MTFKETAAEHQESRVRLLASLIQPVESSEYIMFRECEKRMWQLPPGSNHFLGWSQPAKTTRLCSLERVRVDRSFRTNTLTDTGTVIGRVGYQYRVEPGLA